MLLGNENTATKVHTGRIGDAKTMNKDICKSQFDSTPFGPDLSDLEESLFDSGIMEHSVLSVQKDAPDHETSPIPNLTRNTSNPIVPHLKQQEKPSSPIKPIRKDVLNKTVVRALKRYYTQLFEAAYPTYATSGCKTVQEFESLTTTFVETHFGNSDSQLASMIRAFVNPDLSKKTKRTRKERDFLTEYQACIYKYSTKKLLKLAQNDTFSYLFKDFINKGAFEQLAYSDDNMSQNPEAYISTAKSMVKLFG